MVRPFNFTQVIQSLKDNSDAAPAEAMLQLLFVTPELVATTGFQSILSSLTSSGKLGLLAVDEAHCISGWVMQVWGVSVLGEGQIEFKFGEP